MNISPIKQIEALYQRLEKAKVLVADGKVHPIIGQDGYYTVQGSQGFYLVNGECTCPDAVNRQEAIKGWCKHKLAVELYKEQVAEAPQETEEEREARVNREIAEIGL